MEPSLKRWVTEVAGAERAVLAELDFERQRERFLQHAEGRRPHRRTKLWLALSAAATVAFVLMLGLSMLEPELRFDAGGKRGGAGDWLAAPAHAALPVDFSDGSQLTLAETARARVTELDARGARVLLEHGKLQASVAHAQRTRWQFAAGPFHVEVVGTRFELGWEPSTGSFQLSLQEGSVRVKGPNVREGCMVSAGDELSILLDGGSARGACVAVAAAPKPIGAEPLTFQVPAAPPAAVTPSRKVLPGWRELAARADYATAWAAVEERGFDRVRARASAADLMTLADLARFARQPEKAVSALTQLRERFAGTIEASHAAFSLGRVASDQLGAPEQAPPWFVIYLTERPDGDFASEAMGRLLDCHERAGNTSAARETAARYLELYPDGAYAAMARHMLERQQ
jgi:hypothetical protein